jgi:hypothetical protein
MHQLQELPDSLSRYFISVDLYVSEWDHQQAKTKAWDLRTTSPWGKRDIK